MTEHGPQKFKAVLGLLLLQLAQEDYGYSIVARPKSPPPESPLSERTP